jgi:hypothetical protein
MVEKEEGYSRNLLIRYFLHGIAFSGLFLLLGLVWVVIFAVLVVIGFFIGFIIGLIVLFFIIGGINAFLTDLMWSISVRTDWKGLLSHGFVLFLVLVMVGIPSYLVTLAAPSLVTSIVLFFVYAFIDGYIAKNVAKTWESEEEQE